MRRTLCTAIAVLVAAVVRDILRPRIHLNRAVVAVAVSARPAVPVVVGVGVIAVARGLAARSPRVAHRQVEVLITSRRPRPRGIGGFRERSRRVRGAAGDQSDQSNSGSRSRGVPSGIGGTHQPQVCCAHTERST